MQTKFSFVDRVKSLLRREILLQVKKKKIIVEGRSFGAGDGRSAENCSIAIFP